jgi:hypothetical protein
MKCQVKVLEHLYNLDIMAFIVTGLIWSSLTCGSKVKVFPFINH